MNDDPQKNAENRLDEMGKTRAREIRLVFIFVLMLVFLTLYVLALNAYILYKSRPDPFGLDSELPAGVRNARFAASLRWYEPLGRDVVHPAVWVDEHRIRSVSAEGWATVFDLREKHALRIKVNRSCTAGEHRGELLLRKVDADPGLPESIPVPLTVGVKGGFWGNWFLLKYWLGVLLVMSVVLYLFCVFVFPAPSGWLVSIKPTESFYERSMRRIPIRMRKIAWVFPWMRPTIPMRTLWKSIDRERARGVRGEMLFVLPENPALVSPARSVYRSFSRVVRPEADLDGWRPEDFQDCGGYDIMKITHVYMYGKIEQEGCRLFRYSRKRPAPMA